MYASPRVTSLRARARAGVSLIRLMSRYYNDLRLFIYSSAVLADRTLITGASRYANGIKVPRPPRRRHHVAVANRHANFVDELAARR